MTGAGGRLGKYQRTGLTGQWLWRVGLAIVFVIDGGAKNGNHSISLKRFDAEKMFHGDCYIVKSLNRYTVKSLNR